MGQVPILTCQISNISPKSPICSSQSMIQFRLGQVPFPNRKPPYCSKTDEDNEQEGEKLPYDNPTAPAEQWNSFKLKNGISSNNVHLGGELTHNNGGVTLYNEI